MSETMWDVLSVRDKDKQPVLANCTLLVGEAAIVFQDGVSEVPESMLPLLANNKQVRIPGYKGPAEPVAEKTAEVAVEKSDSDNDADQEKLIAEHLAQEAEVLGREKLTADGQPRCQALKADGSQCANAAVSGGACGLAAHGSQLA